MKKVFGVFFILCFLMILASCKDADYAPNVGENDNQDDGITQLADGDTPERKIIYEVYSTYDVTDLSDSIDTLKALVETDEWFDQESISSSKTTFTVRIKTDRLDAFVDALNSAFQVRTYTKDGQDISLSYQDKTIRIESITLQIERLQVLYASASLSEMITINSELADLETELLVLQGQLSVYDSLIEYSEVHIVLNETTVITKSPFFNRVANGFLTGFDAVVSVLDGLVIAISFLFPFAVVVGPIGYVAYRINKKRKSKKEDTKQE